MAATIKIKNSSTAGAAPTSSDLVQGELAVNVTDKRLYTENASGTIVELGTNPSVPVTFPDGSASAPSLTNDGDTNTGLFFPAADTVGITTGGTERARVDSSGNLGLGVTPSAWGGSYKALQVNRGSVSNVGGTVYFGANFYHNGTNSTYIATDYASLYGMADGQHRWYYAPSGTAGASISFTQAMTLDASGNLGVGTTSPSARIDVSGSGSNAVALIQATRSDLSITTAMGSDGGLSGGFVRTVTNHPLVFGTNNTERARIDSSGNLLVGTTSFALSNSNNLMLQVSAGTFYAQHANGTSSGTGYAGFSYNGSNIGSITQNGTTGVLYNLTSDYRLKNNPTPVTGAKEFVMALQPKTWDWWDGSGKGVGFIAHEFMEVAHYSGHGEKDAVDENGNPVYQSIQPSSSEVMANLVAHIQELETRLAALENK